MPNQADENDQPKKHKQVDIVRLADSSEYNLKVLDSEYEHKKDLIRLTFIGVLILLWFILIVIFIAMYWTAVELDKKSFAEKTISLLIGMGIGGAAGVGIAGSTKKN
jgi:hypothetical protein